MMFNIKTNKVLIKNEMCMRWDEKRHRTIFNILSLAIYTHYYFVFRIQIIKTMLNHCSSRKKGNMACTFIQTGNFMLWDRRIFLDFIN
jgi:hypothetical protein